MLGALLFLANNVIRTPHLTSRRPKSALHLPSKGRTTYILSILLRRRPGLRSSQLLLRALLLRPVGLTERARTRNGLLAQIGAVALLRRVVCNALVDLWPGPISPPCYFVLVRCRAVEMFCLFRGHGDASFLTASNTDRFVVDKPIVLPRMLVHQVQGIS